MASSFKNPLFEAEPYEESQGTEAPASPDELRQFYFEMEKRDQEHRRLSRRQSAGKRWTRPKSQKKTIDGPQQILEEKIPPVSRSVTETRRDKGKEREVIEKPMMEIENRGFQMLDPLQPISIIPDERPAVLRDSKPPMVPPFKAKYPLHNPVGPRWYKNHYLIPPQSRSPPSSSFSPSFPPMATALGMARTDEAGRMPGPSRTPSGSPLPTPTSSQTRIADAGPGSRQRKISQTAHDGVDLLDGTDPWGTSWHHQSPYDVGMNPSQVNIPASSPDGQIPPRQRVPSNPTVPVRRKTAIPSPLSQSTSAVHLTSAAPPPVTVPRRLSKRRKPGLRSLFGGHDHDRGASAPASPYDENTGNGYLQPGDALSMSRTVSRSLTIPAGSKSSQTLLGHSPEKREKRVSVLGRLSKRFSVLRRSATSDATPTTARTSTDRRPVNLNADEGDSPIHPAGGSPDALGDPPSPDAPPAPPKVDNDSSRRAVPLSEDEPVHDATEGPIDAGNRSSASISVDTPFSIGRLMIANPDVPGSGCTTPTRTTAILPPAPHPHEDRFDIEQAYEAALAAVEHPVTNAPSELLSPISIPPSINIERGPSPTSRLAQSSPTSPNTLEVPSTSRHTRALPAWERVDPSTLTPSPSPSVALLPPVPPHSRNSVSAPTVMTLSASERTVMDSSPMSRTSVLVNPPTPFSHSVEFPSRRSLVESSESFIEQPVLKVRNPSPDKDKSSHRSKPGDDGSDHKSSKKDKGKQATTETFKLIRSHSDYGKVQNDTITVGEEQWTLIQAPESAKRDRSTRDKEKSRPKDDKERPRDDKERSRDDKERSRDDKERPRDDKERSRDDKERSRDDKERSRDDKGRSRHEGGRPRDDKERSRDDKERSRDDKDKSRDEKDRAKVREERDRSKVKEERDKPRSKDEKSKSKDDHERTRSKDGESSRRKESRRHESSRHESSRHESSRQISRSEQEKHRDDRVRSSRVIENGSAVKSPSMSQNLLHTTESTKQPEPPTKERLPESQSILDKHSPTSPPDRRQHDQHGLTQPERVERRSSSRRPTSEVNPDFTTMTAREAWEAERMWKGKSAVYGPEVAGVMSNEPVYMNGASPFHGHGAMNGNSSNGGTGHGSSHTSFQVQRPFHGQGSQPSSFYAQVPAPPPPMIYSPQSHTHSSVASPGPYDYPHTYRSFNDTGSFPTIPTPDSSPTRRPLSNPLPDPPRQSAYIPTPPMPNGRASFASEDDPSSPEYWTKYAGITTAH